MKTKMITELVKMEALQTTTDEQLFHEAEVINSFLQKQDGFIDAELVKPFEGNTWFFIYHIENLEKLKAVGEQIRSRNLVNGMDTLLKPGSMKADIYTRVKSWLS